MTRAPVLAVLLALAACSGGDQAGQPSGDEDRQLNDAAAALDANNLAPPPAPEQANESDRP